MKTHTQKKAVLLIKKKHLIVSLDFLGGKLDYQTVLPDKHKMSIFAITELRIRYANNIWIRKPYLTLVFFFYGKIHFVHFSYKKLYTRHFS